MTNLGQKLEIRFDVFPMDVYTADSGCNAELYLNPDVMELEKQAAFYRKSMSRRAAKQS